MPIPYPQEDVPQNDSVAEALRHIADILSPAIAVSGRQPIHVAVNFDWEAIARTGFTNTETVTAVRSLLVITQHALAGDIDATTLQKHFTIIGTRFAQLINATFPADTETVAGSAA